MVSEAGELDDTSHCLKETNGFTVADVVKGDPVNCSDDVIGL